VLQVCCRRVVGVLQICSKCVADVLQVYQSGHLCQREWARKRVCQVKRRRGDSGWEE